MEFEKRGVDGPSLLYDIKSAALHGVVCIHRMLGRGL